MGIDLGSTASKCVILKNGKEVVGSAIIPAGTGTTGPVRAYEECLADAGLKREDLSMIVSTGYGRNSFEQARMRQSTRIVSMKSGKLSKKLISTLIADDFVLPEEYKDRGGRQIGFHI